MVVSENIKQSLLQQLKIKDFIRVPASEDEYLSIAYNFPFKIEYHQSEIIAMGASTFWYEALVTALSSYLYIKYIDKNYYVLGSNMGVKIPIFEGGYYLPDVVVVKGEPDFVNSSTAFISNPFIVIEVLSPSTGDYDLTEKLAEYKHFDSLQQVVFVSQKRMHVLSFIRSQNPGIWINQDFEKETDELIIDSSPILLKDIYQKVKFG